MRKLTLNNYLKLLLTGSLIVVLLINVFIVQNVQLSKSVREIKRINFPKRETDISSRTLSDSEGINATFVRKWGTLGTGDGQFDGAAPIAINSTGHVYVVELYNRRVQVFHKNGTFIHKWALSYNPRGIAINETGHVYISDGSGSIKIYTHNGSLTHQWGSAGSGDGEFSSPRGIAINETGYVYVVDTGNNRVQVFTSNGTFVDKWGSSGSGAGQFDWPSHIAINSLGYVYVTEYNNDRVQVFTSTGTFITKWGSSAVFAYPTGIAIDAQDYVYVADRSIFYNIRVYTRLGAFVGKWGTYGTGDGQFQEAWDVAIDSSGNIYVTDAAVSANRVQVFSVAILSQLQVGIQHLFANNQTINVTFIVTDSRGALPSALLEISNTTHFWVGNSAANGKYNLTLSYTPNEFTLEVNASKSGYLPDNETFVIYIDPPAVDYTPPVDELDPSALATFGMFALIFVAPWIALTAKQWTQHRKKKVR